MSKIFHYLFFTGVFILNLGFSDTFKDLNYDFLLTDDSSKVIKKTSTDKKKDAKKPFKEVIKGHEKIAGLFTLYWNRKKNSAFLAINPDQLETIFLANLTRQSGDALFLDGSSMAGQFPFILRQIGDKIQLVNPNLKFRADEDRPFHRAIESHKPKYIISSTKIESAAHPKSGAFLVDIGKLFIYDIQRLTVNTNGTYIFDKNNSFFKELKSFPFNTEIEIALNYNKKKPVPIYTLAGSGVISSYHISLSTIPESNFKPRAADDRVGHFTTYYQDYSDILRETPYVRYVNRWNLEKEDPSAWVSPPKEPIVYWLENTIPYELRDAVRNGIESWNEAFEAAGFKDAIVVKQMPDDADWDPADVRYNVVRWIFQASGGYAVGPSRANPYTGELYDADIRVSADFVRFFYTEFEELITPLTDEPLVMGFELDNEIDFSADMCHYGEHLKHEMASAWSTMIATGEIKGSHEELQHYIYEGLTDLILHEVGHTLGLRHNFKASSIYSISELSDPEFTEEHGISGSVMDYHPVSLFNGKTFFQTHPGVYDYWAIEYAYKPVGKSKLMEKDFLEKIASRSTEPLLTYGTDEDAFGLSTRGIDPLCNTWDLSDNTIAYYKHRIELAHKLWETIPEKFETEGRQYSKIRRVFSQGIRQYSSASRNVAKYISGIYHSRHHVGDPRGENPFKVVDANKQREALKFILNRILAPDAFNFDPDLLNKLAPKRDWDFTGSVWRMSRIDYPIHDVVRWIQSGTLYRLHHPRIFARIRDNELKMPPGAEVFTLTELLEKITGSVWNEVDDGANINSFRRSLQQTHVEVLTTILLNEKNYFHNDAVALARANMKVLYSRIKHSLEINYFDDYTKAHLSDSANRIYSVYKAQTVLN